MPYRACPQLTTVPNFNAHFTYNLPYEQTEPISIFILMKLLAVIQKHRQSWLSSPRLHPITFSRRYSRDGSNRFQRTFNSTSAILQVSSAAGISHETSHEEIKQHPKSIRLCTNDEGGLYGRTVHDGRPAAQLCHNEFR